MKTQFKVTRLVLAASLGSLIWAGCASDPNNSANVNDAVVAANLDMVPVDQTRRRPDTHPELRSGLWQFTYNHSHGTLGRESYGVVEAPVVQPEVAAADTTSLLGYSAEARNAVAGTAPAAGGVVVEAAGADVDRNNRAIDNNNNNRNFDATSSTNKVNGANTEIEVRSGNTETTIRQK
jgi:hypothetical protein